MLAIAYPVAVIRFASEGIIVEQGSDAESVFVIVDSEAAIRLKCPALTKRGASL